MKKAPAILLILIFFSLTGFLCLYLGLVRYAETPLDEGLTETLIDVRSGQGFGAVSNRLNRGGIIRDSIKFRIVARLKGYDRKIKAGEYRLSSAMSPEEILNTLVDGKVFLRKLTIPEGLNLRQIAEIIGESGIADTREFLKATADADLVEKHNIKAETFEGYLFPETYFFPADTTPEGIISAMVKRFRAVFTPELKKKADSLGFSVHEIVTLASIIEKETGASSERPVISSVFHNRLKKEMRLESDPTVIHGIKNYKGNITRKHLSTPTPYNTYKIKGLPPGPIASPGKASIEAALYPANTKYLFFVSKKNHTHKFSTNLSDHNRAVRKYQLRR